MRRVRSLKSSWKKIKETRNLKLHTLKGRIGWNKSWGSMRESSRRIRRRFRRRLKKWLPRGIIPVMAPAKTNRTATTIMTGGATITSTPSCLITSRLN